MSASLLVDAHGSLISFPSLPGSVTLSPSGQLCGLSGQLCGDIIDLRDANTFTNVYVQGRQMLVGSGAAIIMVQTSADTTSGNFTDPTSGLPASALPTSCPGFQSGGLMHIGSGGGVLSAQVSGQNVNSGFMAFGGFLSPHRYMRLLFGTGTYVGPVAAGFMKQAKTTGSGGGFSFSPSSGSVNV